MHHEFLKHPRHSPHVFHASAFFATALGIALALVILAQGVLAAFGVADFVADHRIAFGLASLLAGLMSASAIFDRYETRD